VQCEKKTAPEPFSPEIHGSSQKCKAQRATFILLSAPQKPVLPEFLSTLHSLRHNLQAEYSSLFTYFTSLLKYCTINHLKTQLFCAK
jgi:hypothetical protein